MGRTKEINILIEVDLIVGGKKRGVKERGVHKTNRMNGVLFV